MALQLRRYSTTFGRRFSIINDCRDHLSNTLQTSRFSAASSEDRETTHDSLVGDYFLLYHTVAFMETGVYIEFIMHKYIVYFILALLIIDNK